MRESGYYWIKLSPPVKGVPMDTEDGWEVAYYYKEEGWYSIWDGGEFQDEDLIEINENRLKNKLV